MLILNSKSHYLSRARTFFALFFVYLLCERLYSLSFHDICHVFFPTLAFLLCLYAHFLHSIYQIFALTLFAIFLKAINFLDYVKFRLYIGILVAYSLFTHCTDKFLPRKRNVLSSEIQRHWGLILRKSGIRRFRILKCV